MKKSALISVLVVLLALVLGLWYYGSGADVKITDMYASPFGAGDSGKLNITLQNNGLKPVDVWLEVENAFVDENGTSYSTPRLIISDNSTTPWMKEQFLFKSRSRLFQEIIQSVYGSDIDFQGNTL